MNDADLLEILQTYKWIKVPTFKDDPLLNWQDRFQRLHSHHIEETTFLIERVRQLAQELIDTRRIK